MSKTNDVKVRSGGGEGGGGNYLMQEKDGRVELRENQGMKQDHQGVRKKDSLFAAVDRWRSR